MNVETLLFYKCFEKVRNEPDNRWHFKPLKKCACQECFDKDKCETLIGQDLTRIKAACIKKPCRRLGNIPDTKTSDYNYAATLGNGGWIGNRQVKFELPYMHPKSALELLSNGDCASNRD